MNHKNFKFQKKEVLIELEQDPFKTNTTELAKLLKGTVINKGSIADDYAIGDVILVRKDNTRDLDAEYFPKNVLLIRNQDDILCKF